MEGGTITFTNLTIQDAMVFQCNASNIYGYIFANAYLNVQCKYDSTSLSSAKLLSFKVGVAE